MSSIFPLESQPKIYSFSEPALSEAQTKLIKSWVAKTLTKLQDVSDVDKNRVAEDVSRVLSSTTKPTKHFCGMLIFSRIVAEIPLSNDKLELLYQQIVPPSGISKANYLQDYVDYWKLNLGVVVPGFRWRSRNFPGTEKPGDIPVDNFEHIENVCKKRKAILFASEDAADALKKKQHSAFDSETNPFVRRRTTPKQICSFLKHVSAAVE